MALNTQPLNPSRRALLVSVLLLCFLGSLGFAQWLSVSRRTSLALSVLFPAELSQTVKTPVSGLYDAREGIVDGKPRQLYYFFYEHVPLTDPGALQSEAVRLFVEATGEMPLGKGQAVLARHSAVELDNMGRKNGGFAILRFTVIADRAIGVLYSGPGELTDADEGLFTRVTGELRVIDMNARRRAQTED